MKQSMGVRAGLGLAALALLSGCALKTIHVTEEQFLPQRKTDWLSDRITRTNLELPLPDLPGQSLKGWRLNHPSPKAALVFFYGGGNTLWENLRLLHELSHRLEVDVVAYDVRGTGASGGKTRFETLRADALRIYDQQAKAGLPTLVMGYSLGSIPAVHLAANRPVQGLFVAAGISSFDEAKGHFDKLVPWYAKPFVGLEFAPVFQQRPQPVDQIATVKAPTLVMHGDADETLPVQCGDSLAQHSAASWKRYARLTGRGHGNLPLSSGEGLTAIKEWVAQASTAAQPS
ncbi:alpha/beta hydrolase [Inhella gelatinilytica]|uniref:Alpha/beta fold hydrolase n=1 Tax=Inhella gelatinilytica TaxID=2795030 RepID=A0A931ND06_9BURK|nr:alpha/beta fold hydrolase [Inhella gelatinilytica]MBH9552094.1 alpha/beta fold hydrolase [Inhella gelatinilytica]